MCNLKISIIGVGAQGSDIAHIFSKTPEVSQVVCADIDLNRARRLVEKLKSDKFSAVMVDASKVDDLLRVIKGSETVINAALPRFDHKIMDAALKSGACYVDFASSFPLEEGVPKKLALDEKFKDAGLTAVVNQGGPFTVQVAIRYVADRLDRVDEIRLRNGSTGGEEEEFIPTWSPEWCTELALDEWIHAMIYENGKWKEVPTFSGVEDYLFPEPVGPVTVCNVDYEAIQTLPRFIGKGVKYVDAKIHPDRMAGSLIKMGLASGNPIEVKGVKVAPRDVLLTLTPPAYETASAREKESIPSGIETFSCFLAEVKGEKAGEKIIHTVYKIFNFRKDHEEFGIPYVGVAVPAVITATMLAKGEIKIKGVIPPEGLDPEPFMAKLADKGWVFQESITKEIRP